MKLGKEVLLSAAMVLAATLPGLAQSGATQVASGPDCAAVKGACKAGGHHHRCGGFRKGREGGHFGMLQGKYALTAEQEKKLESIRAAFKSEIKPQFEGKKAVRTQMMDLLTAPQIDTAKVNELQNEINSQSARLATLKTQSRLKEMEVLTADQRKELKDQFAKLRTEWEQRRKGGSGASEKS